MANDIISQQKIVTLPILEYYDSKLKNWVVEKIDDANQYVGYCALISEIPTTGKEGDYILVGETNSFWTYNKETGKYIDTMDYETYNDSGIKAEIKNIIKIIEGLTNEALTNEELEMLLK